MWCDVVAGIKLTIQVSWENEKKMQSGKKITLTNHTLGDVKGRQTYSEIDLIVTIACENTVRHNYFGNDVFIITRNALAVGGIKVALK